MGAHLSIAEPFAQLVRHPLDQPAGIDKNQAGAMRLYLRDELIVDHSPDILSDNRPQLDIRHFHAELHVPFVADIDDRTLRRSIARYRMAPDQQAAIFFDRFLRGAKADSL